ncbi:MAG: T9SS type A sorting domain-containing protein, partial [Rhodothermales bacterium]
PETVIPFGLPEEGHVRVSVYDVLGRLVTTLVDGVLSAGRHEVVFRADRLPTGVYLIRMEVSREVRTQRVTLMK